MVCAQWGISPAEELPVLETPKSSAHGDLATNLAMKLARQNKKNPREIASAIKLEIETQCKKEVGYQTLIRKVEVEGPGFINLFLTETSRADILLVVQSQNEKFGASHFGNQEKVVIEFVSANPTGPLTIAHGRQAAIGDALANILRTVGYQVHKEFYLNDAGRQIRLLGESLWARYQSLNGRAADVPKEGYQGVYLIELAKELTNKEGEKLLQKKEEEAVSGCRQYAVQSILAGMKKDLKDIGVIFDTYFEESSLHSEGKVNQALEKLEENHHLFESEGALWFRSSVLGDDKDRVLRKQTGEYTYLTADIAYHESKFNRGYKKIVNLWGPDHHGYVARLKAACEALGFSREQIHVLIVQLTTLYRKGVQVRMSTRAGEFVTLRELIDEVGADAARFFFLMRRVESHLDFDLELAKEKSQDNPVYYLQYAHARMASILAAANRPIDLKADIELLKAPEEIELLKKLADYPETLKQAASSLEPYRVVEYLRELAALFHKFYAVCRVIGEEDRLTAARLLLTDSVRIVIRNGLRILGVSQPEKM